MNQDYFCTYLGHEDEPISGFCLCQNCPNKSQWCVQCFTAKHKAHQNECKTFAQIKILIKINSTVISDWQKKVQEDFEKVQQLFKLVYKFLENQKTKMAELESLLVKQEYQQFQQDLGSLKQWSTINLTTNGDLLSMLSQLKDLSITMNKKSEIQIPEKVSQIDLNIINQGLEYKRQGKPSLALQSFEAAIKRGFKKVCLTLRLGWVLDDLQRYSDAIKCFDQAININPKYVYAFNNKGITLHKLRSYTEAIQCFNQAISLDPSFAQAYNNKGKRLIYLGFSLYSKSRYQEGIECYNQAINLDPKYAQAYFNKGLLLQQLNKYDQAIKFFEQAINIDPRFAEAYFKQGV